MFTTIIIVHNCNILAILASAEIPVWYFPLDVKLKCVHKHIHTVNHASIIFNSRIPHAVGTSEQQSLKATHK
jgi:hypothetical protein